MAREKSETGTAKTPYTPFFTLAGSRQNLSNGTEAATRTSATEYAVEIAETAK